MDKCPKCDSKNVTNVNVSPFFDIPERERTCRNCEYRGW